jgi:hypothetical protein
MENADLVGALLSLLDTWCMIGNELAQMNNGPNLIVEFIFANEAVMDAIEDCRTKFAGRLRKEANGLLEVLSFNN